MLLSSLLPLVTLTSAVSSLVINIGVNTDIETKALAENSRDNSVGSIYFMTNEPSGNFVVSASIGPDGLLTPSRAISTRGIGGHGISSIGLDPLFSQGSVVVSPRNGLLAAVNPGSNTVQLFAIDPLAPAILRPIGPPALAGGDFPTSAVFNSAGNVLCVLSGGVGACVRCFSVDARRGLFVGSTRSLGLNKTTPPTGFADTVTTVRFTPDDATVLVLVKGSPDAAGKANGAGMLLSWTLASARAAKLSTRATFEEISSVGGIPFSVTDVPGRRAFLSADAGVDVFDYSRGFGAGKVVRRSAQIPGQVATCWSAYSEASGSFYVADILMSTITEISVGQDLVPSIVRQYVPPAVNTGTNEMATATVNGQGFMYVLLPNATSVGVMRINGPGDAEFIQVVDFAGSAAATNLTMTSDHMAGMGIFLKRALQN